MNAIANLKEIFNSGKLDETSTIRKIRIVQNEDSKKVSREVEFYNLDHKDIKI